METATLANGCFWCTEAVFKRLKGIASVQSGFSGGHVENPTYERVSVGTTGHAECIQIQFDPKIISYETVLDIFFATHDPTTKDRQGNDVGTQYRSAIFYHDEKQKEIAEAVIAKLEASKKYEDPIVTQIVPYETFYKVGNEHDDYYDTNRSAPYCRIIIDPKIQKLLKQFSKEVKDEYK